jgi:hypothetical protein
MLPTFIGIGAPKAGTTWLYRCLQEHPQVFVAPVKETNFFVYHTIEGRLGEYEMHFADAAGADAIGEVSTTYFSSDCAPERIQHCLPEIRLFVSLRNPIDQIYSHYWHLRRQNFHRWGHRHVPRNFEEALEHFPDQLLKDSLYGQHLHRWLQHFDQDRLLVIFFDDVKEKPHQVLKSLYGFIGVEPGFSPSSFHETGATVRQGVSPRGLVADRLYPVIYDRLNRHIYHPIKKAIGWHRADALKEALKLRLLMERIFFRTGYPPMAAETRALLREKLAPDIAQLSALAGHNLDHWK